MRESWIKINDETFFIKDMSIQLSIGSHANLELSFDINQYPSYSNIFFNKYERREKFNIVGKEFEAKGIIIKTIDIDKSTMNTSLRCDLLNHKDISERREEIIDEVLNNEQNNNIK
jgi:hypothetical protein